MIKGKYQTHCKRGHPLFGDNVKIYEGHRHCLICKKAASKAIPRDIKNARNAEWRRKNPAAAARRGRRQALRRNYGLGQDEYDQMLLLQNGVCAICKRKCVTGKSLAVDHDHATGLNRGLLCANCNNGLGRFKDNPDFLKAALDYLLTHSTQPDTLPK